MISRKITEKFLANIGLFENVLGKYSDLVAIDQEVENSKKILCDVYGFKDIYDIVPKRLDHNGMDKFLRTVFTYYEAEQEEKKGILSK